MDATNCAPGLYPSISSKGFEMTPYDPLTYLWIPHKFCETTEPILRATGGTVYHSRQKKWYFNWLDFSTPRQVTTVAQFEDDKI